MADKFNARLMAAMQLMGNPVKDTKGHNYKYAQLDQVTDVVKPALYSNGLAFRQENVREGGEALLKTVVFDEAEERVMDTRPIPDNADPQKRGSWETYQRRYALLTVFGLAPEDDDGAAAKPAQKAKAPSQAYEAKRRLKAAMQDYCERHGVSFKAEAEELGGNDHINAQSAEWLNAKADYYEAN